MTNTEDNHCFHSAVPPVKQKCSMNIPSQGDLGNLRGMSLGFSSPVFWVALSLNVIFLVILRWGTIYGCRKCDVLIFVPLNTTANIIISVASGMICLAEYTSVPRLRWFPNVSIFFNISSSQHFQCLGKGMERKHMSCLALRILREMPISPTRHAANVVFPDIENTGTRTTYKQGYIIITHYMYIYIYVI